MLVSQEEKFLNLFLETHNRQITDLKEQNHKKEKWIRFLVGALVAMTMFIGGLLLYIILIHESEPPEIDTADVENVLTCIKHTLFKL